jgi:hypothetical protein
LLLFNFLSWTARDCHKVIGSKPCPTVPELQPTLGPPKPVFGHRSESSLEKDFVFVICTVTKWASNSVCNCTSVSKQFLEALRH